MKPQANNSYSVIIVGAGPAGTTLGYELARQGIDVLILEKAKLPRYKTCAGGITTKTYNLLGINIDSLLCNKIYGARITYKFGNEFVKRYHEPLTYMVMRDEFDYLLTQQAQEAGAVVIDTQRVSSIEILFDHARVTTDTDIYKGKILVGADGANSVVAKKLDLTKGLEFLVGMEAKVTVSNNTMNQWDSYIGMDLGCIRKGYSWVFPKKEHLSIGIVGPLAQTKRMKAICQNYIDSLNLGSYQINNFRGHFLPTRRDTSPIQRERSLLLGDAAGLVDPLSGEGIYYAIKSAQLAAPVIAQNLRNNTTDLQKYQQMVNSEISPELKVAHTLWKLFSWFPRPCFSCLRRSDRLWESSCRLVRGEKSYVSIKNKLGLFKFT